MADAAALALPEAAPPARPRVLLAGTALAASAAFMGIIGLVGIYLSTRAATIAGGNPWLPEGSSLPLTPGNMAMATMLISGITMWWAVDAVGKNDRQMAYLALGMTIFFGVAVINAITFLYSQMGLAASTVQGQLIFAITGAQIAMIIVGLVYAAVMTFRTLGGEYQGRDREGLTAAALFWYVTTASMVVIWYVVFITK